MKRPDFSWDLSRVDEKIEPCLEAVTDPHRVEMVREVCEAFIKNVKPKLHRLPKHIIPLSSEELEVLPVLVAPRFCQSLLCGAFISKHVDPGNEYILETAKNGWKVFEEF